MNNLLSDRALNLTESATIAMSRKSRELKEQGVNVISLSLGEPDFNVPEFVKEAGISAIIQDFSKYPPVPGYKDLKEAISAKFKRDNNLDYTMDQIVVSTGAKQSIMNVVLSLINYGDEVILPAPYWVSYAEMVKFAGGVPVVIETNIENDFKLTPQQLQKAITPKTKLMIFSSPCNPSGAAYTKDGLGELAKVISGNDNFMVIADEIYEYINFSGNHYSLASYPAMYERVMTINGVSKGFAMTGYRIGYMGAPKWVADSCTKIQGQFTSGASSIAQMAAKKAVLTDPSEISFMRDAFMKRRDLVKTLLDEIKGVITNVPEGAFYHFPDVSALFGKSTNGITVNSSSDLAMYLLSEAHVAVVGGDSFGNPKNIRLSYAASEDDLKEALSRMKIAIEKLS
jgi:aspartate aminotransferase